MGSSLEAPRTRGHNLKQRSLWSKYTILYGSIGSGLEETSVERHQDLEQLMEAETYHKDEGHEATEDCEEDVASLIAEAATSLKQYESGHK